MNLGILLGGGRYAARKPRMVASKHDEASWEELAALLMPLGHPGLPCVGA